MAKMMEYKMEHPRLRPSFASSSSSSSSSSNGEVGWPVDSWGIFEFTTQVSIVPNVLPYPQCSSHEECHGVLL